MLLKVQDEPLVREYLLAAGIKGDCAAFERVVEWLERHQRFTDALKLWEQARDYWEAALNTPESDWHKRKYAENLKEAIENIQRLSKLAPS
jgi:hypothetical protein